MSKEQEDFLQRLRATFKVEAEEHLQAMSSGLLEMEKIPPAQRSAEQIETIFRHAHSLKGAARAVNAEEIERICQSLETTFAAWKRGQIFPSAEDFDALHRAVDLIGRILSTDQTQPAAQPSRAPVAPEPASPAKPAPAEETIRISTAKLDRLLLEAEELLGLKQTTAQRAADFRELDALFDQWARRQAALMGDDSGQFKLLVEKVRSLGKSAAKDAHTAGQLVDDLLADSKNLLMLPFSTLADLFPKLVRDLSRDQGKDAEVVLRGGEVEMDKRILEEMKDPLIHLLRNCIDHGVEKPEPRALRNKSARATITITATQTDSNRLEIVVSDDGAGIDISRVKDSAVKHRIISAEEADRLDDAEALDLIFRSEISTSALITEISGRGLGLAIVREKAEKLGGHVSVAARPGEGASFRIVLPLTRAVFRGVLVRAASHTLVIPSVNVERVTRVKSEEIKTIGNRETITLDGSAVSLARLDAVLEITHTEPNGSAAGFIPVVLLASGGERIAFAVDEVLHNEEVLVKPLARPLVRVRNIASATVLASGKVAPVLHVADLMKSARKTAGPSPLPRASAAAPRAEIKSKSILLVEDSITSRMLLKGILESAGYSVKTAVDGVDGLTTLRAHHFDLVVSDIEMPRMNGFTLTAQIRADKKLADLPVVLVSALASNEDREQGINAGANAYIVKSSFDQSNLLEIVDRLI